MAEELSLDVLPEMKRADYIKAFKNKASANVSEIFVKADDYDSALKIANLIDNPVTKAGAYQKIVDAQLGLNKQND
jgi:hypothetical protein